MSPSQRMRRYIRLSLSVVLVTILIGSQKISNQRAIAGDLLFLLTNPADQESVVIGEASSIDPNQLIFEPKQVLVGKRVPRKIAITDYDLQQAKSLNNGDAAVLTLVRADRKREYRLAHTAFKVSSSEPTEATIITGPLSGGDRIAYNWFINSCGAERDFAFDYSGKVDVSFVKREAELVAIAQRSKDTPDSQWVMTAKPPACKPSQATSWWQLLVKRLTATKTYLFERSNISLGQ